MGRQGAKGVEIGGQAPSKAYEKVSTDFTARMLPFRFMVSNYLTLYLYRSLAAVERLALQESHFNNFHNLAPTLYCFAFLGLSQFTLSISSSRMT